MAIKTFKRYELKYRLNEQQYRAVIDALADKASPDKYCVGGKTYGLYNLYCDTDVFDIARHSVSKPAFKQKLRIRSYIENPADDDTVFVELKKKYDGCVNKRRATMTYAQALSLLSTGVGNRSGDYISDQVTRELERYIKLNPVYPRVALSYQREAYFLKEDSKIRITFDTQIKAGLVGQEQVLLEPEGIYIMEIKISEKIPLWLVRVLTQNKIYRQGFSKYGTYFNKYIAGKDIIYNASVNI